jgi:hypothetical protein
MTKEQKINWLVAYDIKHLREDLANSRFEFAVDCLMGQSYGQTPYGDCDEQQIDLLYKDALEDGRLDCPKVESIFKCLES